MPPLEDWPDEAEYERLLLEEDGGQPQLSEARLAGKAPLENGRKTGGDTPDSGGGSGDSGISPAEAARLAADLVDALGPTAAELIRAAQGKGSAGEDVFDELDDTTSNNPLVTPPAPLVTPGRVIGLVVFVLLGVLIALGISKARG
jgi:hypothetical protein